MVTERFALRAMRVLAFIGISFFFPLAATPARAEDSVPAQFTRCPGKGWQISQYVLTAGCTAVEACIAAGGNGQIHYAGSNRYCHNNTDGNLIFPGLTYPNPGPASCPANSTLEVDGLTGSRASCACARGFVPENDQCVPNDPVVIEIAGRSSTKALPAGPALTLVARVTRGGRPWAKPGNEIDVFINGQLVAAEYGYPKPELEFTFVPGDRAGEDTITAKCTLCTNTATKRVTVHACDSCETVGNPIRVATGEKVQAESDWVDSSPHPLSFTRHYGSRRNHLDGLGVRWSHGFAARVTASEFEAQANFGTGERVLFTRAGAQHPWVADNPRERLESFSDGHVVTRQADESRWAFDANGRLLAITARNGWRYTLQYGAGGQLASVTNAFGRSLAFTFTGAQLTAVTTPDGQVFRYSHTAAGELASATSGDGSTRGYLYENPSFATALTGIVAEDGSRLSTFGYDGMGRAVRTQHAAGAEVYAVQYPQSSRGSSIVRGAVDGGVYVATADIAHPSGGTQRRTWMGGDGTVRLVGASSPAGGIGFAARSAEPLPTGEVDFTGVQTTFAWDTARGLKTAITEAANKPEARTTQTTWHPAFRLPARIDEAGRSTAYEYDSFGNMLVQTVTDTATGEARTWRWTYGPNNLVATMADPRGGVWQYGYDAAGNRTSVKNPLGETATSTFDAAGRVLTQTSPSGLRTAFEYDTRGRLVKQSSGDEASSYTYTASGQLATATLPNGSSVTYLFDTAQRLVGARDSSGASISYTLDAAGNRVREEVRDAGGAIALVTGRVIDSLNRVTALQGASTQTQLAYDANGELVAQTDALNQTTRQALDGLRRTTGTAFPDNASATQAWSPLDQLTQFTDPKGVATRYTYNAFGDVTSETSPDIGTITYVRDANGDITSMRDAKGQLTQIERDALGRIVRTAYADGTRRSFTYDAAGEVSRLEDRSGATTYERDDHGRVLAKTQDVNDSSTPSRFHVGYAYTAGDLTGITYPSGLKVSYRRTNGRITGVDVQEPGGTVRKPKPVTPFVTDLTHTALGQPKAWRWFTGDAATRSFDADGRMTSNEFASYVYDAAGRITGITQHLWMEHAQPDGSLTVSTTPLAWQAGYDARNRLTSFIRDGAETRYAYDANSNRLTSIEVTTSDTDLDGEFELSDFSKTTRQASNVEGTSNRLLGLTQTLSTFNDGKTRTQASTTVNYTVDANGSMTSDGLRDFVYGGDGRLQSVRAIKDGEAASISYLVNGFGQRVFKGEPHAEQTLPNEAALGPDFLAWLKKHFGWLFAQAAASTSIGTAYLYGDGEPPSWALLGEYDNGSASGKGRVEYIWLPTPDGSAIPIGLYRNGSFFAIHTDHLGTPRLMTTEAKKVVWQWPYSTFGQNKPTGVLRATPNPKAAITNKPVLLKATAATEMNLRFPGQYFDTETGLFQNWIREYDPRTGRYPQSDPIGLRGGWNGYTYGDNSPLTKTDPNGLQAAVPTPLGPVPLPIPTPAPNLSPRPMDPSEPGGPTFTPGIRFPSLVLPPTVSVPLAILNWMCSESKDYWTGLKPYRGKTKTNGESGKSRRYFEWDYTHGDVEVYDSRGNHLGSASPANGEMTKPPVPGRKIDL